MHRGRRRDALGIFIPNDPNFDNQLVEIQRFPRDEEEDLKTFIAKFSNFSSFETSYEEKFDHELIDNPFYLIVPQPIMANHLQRPNQPTFPFPIVDQNELITSRKFLL
jgi:hypothetical protein